MKSIWLGIWIWLWLGVLGWADAVIYYDPTSGKVIATTQAPNPITVDYELQYHPPGTKTLRLQALPERKSGEYYAVSLDGQVSIIPLPNPDPNFQALLETAITNATTLQELKDALLGKNINGKVKAERP